jgi:hypothetical protein
MEIEEQGYTKGGSVKLAIGETNDGSTRISEWMSARRRGGSRST